MSSVAVLSQGVGYAIVLGIGFFFSFLMIGIAYIQNRYTAYQTTNVSEFTSASHSVKPGMIAAGIVSAWTWAATLLQSSAMAYKVGISGPWWYAAGATVQVLLFAQNAVKLKMNAPHAHTFLEVIKARWGVASHLTHGFFALATNVMVSSMLITGGSDTVSALTGMHTVAACMLIPLGVVIYVIVGGMRASLLADYIHTSFLYAIILTFMFTVYTTSDQIGSPAKMYQMLRQAAIDRPVKGNYDGEYVTMHSKSGLIFGVINVVGNFATVFLDQAYWQRAIASDSVTCVKAYILGGSAWFSVPLGFATTMGLSAVVLSTLPSFPTYPDLMTSDQVGQGLPAAFASAALKGKGGAALVLVLLFLAVTSATSAELVAVSSVFTYDIYVPYFRPHASEKEILFVDHLAIAGYGLIMGVLGVIFYYAGISMGWLYEFMGVILGACVTPTALAIMSHKANKWGCIVGSWVGLACGLITWLVATSTLNGGVVTVTTTFQDYPMLSGNLASLGVGTIISVGTSLIWPENYDWHDTRRLYARGESGEDMLKDGDDSAPETPPNEASKEGKDATTASLAELAVTVSHKVDDDRTPGYLERLQKDYRLAVMVSLALTLILLILVPLPLFFTNYIYSEKGFTAWVAVAIVWVFYGAFAVVVYPLWESRSALIRIFKGITNDLFRRGRKASN